MAQWFYRDHHGKEIGPISGSHLLDLIRRGDVISETEVRKDDSSWIRACEVNGLWQAVGRPTVLFYCPHCNGIIDKPPTTCKDCRKEIKKAVGQLVTHSRPKDSKHRWENPTTVNRTPKAPPLQ